MLLYSLPPLEVASPLSSDLPQPERRAEAANRQREAFEITPFRKDAGEDDQGREG